MNVGAPGPPAGLKVLGANGGKYGWLGLRRGRAGPMAVAGVATRVQPDHTCHAPGEPLVLRRLTSEPDARAVPVDFTFTGTTGNANTCLGSPCSHPVSIWTRNGPM